MTKYDTAPQAATSWTVFEQSVSGDATALPTPAAVWHWDLASGKIEWDARLRALFGYGELVTDGAWRENRIHPEDRDRVKLSLQRATIVNHGGVWSERYRFRQADGSYADVTERAFIVHDNAGPRGVIGAITPAWAGAGSATRR